MLIATVNDMGPTGVQAHRADCRDLTRHNADFFLSASIRDAMETVGDYDTKHEVWAEYNADFIAEGSGAWDIHFAGCTRGLPDGPPMIDPA